MRTGKSWLALLLILAMIVGARAAWARHLLENNNRRVELAVDARLLGGSACGQGSVDSPREKLEGWKAAGCTAVAVSPLSLNELERQGEIVSLTPTLYLIKGENGLGERLLAALGLLLPDVELKKLQIDPLNSYAFDGSAGEMATPGTGRTTVTPAGLAPAAGSEAIAPVAKTAPAAAGGGTAEYQALLLPARFVPAIKEVPLLFPGEQMLAWQQAGLRCVLFWSYPSRFPSLLSEKYWEGLARQLQEMKHALGLQFGPVVFPSASFSYPLPQGAAGLIFQAEGFSLGAVEFTQGQGLQGLAAALDYRLLRTHQISGAELAQLGEARARERFLRAVQERKIRLLLLQPFPELDPRNEEAAYLSLLQNLNSDLQKAGFQPGEASFFLPFQLPAAAEALLGAGIAAAAVLLAAIFLKAKGKKTGSRLLPLAGTIFILATAGFMLAGARLPFYTAGRQMAALAAALVFPLLSTLLFLKPPLTGLGVNDKLAGGEAEKEAGEERGIGIAAENETEGEEKDRGENQAANRPFYAAGRALAALAATLLFPLKAAQGTDEAHQEPAEGKQREAKETQDMGRRRGLFPRYAIRLNMFYTETPDMGRRRGLALKLLGGLLLAALLTTGGALLAAGLLGSTPFLLKIESFRGVKIAQAGPFLLFGLWFILQGGRGLWRAGWDFIEARLKVKHLLLLALAGGILLIYLLRGGNTSFLPVSGWELALRRRLEILLVARPRFKEFLIGHPGFFLFATLAAFAARQRRAAKTFATLALLLGLLAQISLFNTFMHLHRPVGLSFWGTVYGVGLGALGGLALYGLARAATRRWLNDPPEK